MDFKSVDGWKSSRRSQWFKKEFGDYPPKEILVGLAEMSKEEREEHTWFGLYLWEKKNHRRKMQML